MARGISAMAQSLNSTARMVAGVGGYAAGRRDNRKIRSWRPTGGSVDADILPDLPELRSRSRDLVRNAPLVAGALRTKTNGVIGTGLRFKAELDAQRLKLTDEQAIRLEDQIEEEFALWAGGADFSGKGRHFYMLQRLIYRSMRENGDVGIVRRHRKDVGNPYSTKLVLIESDRISNPKRRADSARIRGGIQHRSGQVEGYWISDRHPGDLMATALKWSFVPRLGKSGLPLFLLPFDELRVGQVRGVPEVAPLITSLKQISDYSEAEISSAVNSAMLFAFETLGEADQSAGVEHLVDAPAGEGAAAGDKEVQLEDLTIITLSPGSDVKINAPSRPNPQFEPFIAAVLKSLGAALQLPHEVLLMHFSSSYSASRAALELAWKAFQAERAELVHVAFDPILEWFYVEMISLGRLEAPGFFDDPAIRAAWMGHQWVAPTRIQIDPVKEAHADEIDVAGGFKTIEQVLVERTGGDFPRKHRQRAAEHKKRIEAGMEQDISAITGKMLPVSTAKQRGS